MNKCITFLLLLLITLSANSNEYSIDVKTIMSENVLFRVPSLWVVKDKKVTFYARGSTSITHMKEFLKNSDLKIGMDTKEGQLELQKLEKIILKQSKETPKLQKDFILYMGVDDPSMPCEPCRDVETEIDLLNELSNTVLNKIYIKA